MFLLSNQSRKEMYYIYSTEKMTQKRISELVYCKEFYNMKLLLNAIHILFLVYQNGTELKFISGKIEKNKGLAIY